MAAVRIPLKGSAPAMLLPDVSRITTRLSADDLVTFIGYAATGGRFSTLQ